jgi:hypothetical protein
MQFYELTIYVAWRYYIKDIPEHGYRYSGLKSKDMKNNPTTNTLTWQLLPFIMLRRDGCE